MEKSLSKDPKTQALAGYLVGLEVAIVHVFTCLHRQGVLPLDEAASSLRATADGLPANAHENARVALRHIALAVENVAQQPTGEAPRWTPQVILGSLSDSDQTTPD
jgi:hypothetical protein